MSRVFGKQPVTSVGKMRFPEKGVHTHDREEPRATRIKQKSRLLSVASRGVDLENRNVKSNRGNKTRPPSICNNRYVCRRGLLVGML